MSNKELLLDIMVDGRFYTQLRYNGHPFPKLIDGEVVPVYDRKDIERFVIEKRPSLKGKKNVTIAFAKQKVFAR